MEMWSKDMCNSCHSKLYYPKNPREMSMAKRKIKLKNILDGLNKNEFNDLSKLMKEERVIALAIKRKKKALVTKSKIKSKLKRKKKK